MRGTNPSKTKTKNQKETYKMKLYIYSNETNQHVATITGSTNEVCEAAAEENYGSNDYNWNYVGGEECADAQEIEA
jgi:hypothetical protein